MTSLIEHYVDMQAETVSPEIFDRWSAISLVASLLQRKCWLVSAGRQVYPSMIIALVGPPGTGKSTALSPLSSVLYELYPKNTSAQTTTKEAVIKNMDENRIEMILDMEPYVYSPYIGAVGELNVLLRPGDIEFLNLLNALWDCEDSFIYKTKNSGDYKIPNPFLSLIGGSTVKGLASILPEDAYSSGFTARTILVHSAEKITKTPALSIVGESSGEDRQKRKEAKTRLLELSREISALQGEFSFDRAAADFLISWHDNGCQPTVDDPRFEIYNDRRFLHLLKLAMIMSADKSRDKVILEDHAKEALHTLLETERVMPRAVEYITNNKLSDTYKRLLIWCKNHVAIAGNNVDSAEMSVFLHNYVDSKAAGELMFDLQRHGWGQFHSGGGLKYFEFFKHKLQELQSYS